jgi:DNA-binding transcriptional ArsR family regulator
MNFRLDPNAILYNRKNYLRGIINRSKIILYLKKKYLADVNELSEYLGISRSATRYHLILLRKYGVCKKIGRKWKLTKNIQRTLDEYVSI